MASPIELRDYQIRVDQAQQAFMNNDEVSRAIVAACTGSGKTINFTKLIIDETLKRKAEGRKMSVLLVHPRLALTEEQQLRMHEHLVLFDLTWEFIGLHSGQIVAFRKRKTKSTPARVPTTLQDATELAIHKKTCEEDLHVTWTTYHSLEKVRHLDFDLIICDEAHHLAYGEFHANVKFFPEKAKVLFYTATPVGVQDEDAPNKRGMLNDDLFGKVIAKVPPKELIDKKFIVPPKIFFMAARTVPPEEENNKEEKGKKRKRAEIVDYAQLIGIAYNDQLKHVLPDFNHKMLVAMPNVYMFDDITENRKKISDEVGRYVDLYCVSADRHFKNGESYSSRSSLIRDFSKNQGSAVILHCDTLSEGMDVDGIGGVLFLRRFIGKVKSLQTLGRACRPAKADVRKDGSIVPNRKKTHAIITLSEVDGKWESDKEIPKWATAFSEGEYGDLWSYVEPEPVNTRKGGGDDEERDELLKRRIAKASHEEISREELNQLRLDLGLPVGDGGLGNVSIQQA